MGTINSRWKDNARKAILADQVELESIQPDPETLKEWKEAGKTWLKYWIKPKKYSIKGKFRVDSLAMKSGENIPPAVAKKIAKLYQENPDLDESDPLAILELLGEEEVEQIISSQLVAEDNSAVVLAIIEEGLGETNLIGENETIADFASAVLEFTSVADEIVKLIRDFNRPLVEKRGGKSEKQSGMSSGE